MALRFDPGDPTFVEDPYPSYKVLRDEHPTYLHEPTGFYMITRHADVGRVLTDHATFSSSKGNVVVDSPLRVGRTLGSLDPPRHDELRRTVMRGVTPARIEMMLPAIEADVTHVLDKIGSSRSCEFMADISRPILYAALGRMLGLDDTAAARAAELCAGLFHTGEGAMGPAFKGELMQAVFALLAGQLERRRTERGSDLFSVLLEEREKGAPLSDDEILGNMSTVLLAGNASVGHYFSNLIYGLWRHPEQRRKLVGDLSKLPAAIEEGVRWDTSTQAFARQTVTEVTLNGVTIPADRRMVVFYAAANRDERAIERPDLFDIERPKARHFGWGSGPHICLGAQTARAMLRTILGVLLPALGHYELDIAGSERIAHVMVRGFYKLPIRW